MRERVRVDEFGCLVADYAFKSSLFNCVERDTPSFPVDFDVGQKNCVPRKLV
jgi:hypothetical protein